MGYLGMMGYMLVSYSVQKDIQSVPDILAIYSMTDPSNADVSYFYGVYLAKKGQFKAAIDSLGNSLNKGFNDYTRWADQQEFSRLLDSV